MEVAKKLGEEIKNIRTDILNITQKDMAEKLNISIVYMSYLEKGKKIPSKDFLDKMYKLIGKKNIPDDIIQLLSDVKKQKKKENFVNTPTNVVYRLEEEGLYSYTKLKTILKKNGDNLAVIYGILTLLLKEGKINEAKKHLLQSLINIEKPEERKWIEASYYELEGNFPFAIQLMHDSINEFDKRIKNFDENDNKVKARLLFETACIHFRYGQHLYYNGNKDECVKNFNEVLKYHESLKNLSYDPFYMMDYAGIFFWLALLNVESEKNWKSYIDQVKAALIQNYQTGMKNFDVKRWKSLYSKQYIISTVSFLVRAYAELARYKSINERKSLFNEGDFLLSIHTPVDISIHNNEYYRYYFNKACFYSLKSELSESEKEKKYNLDLVYSILEEAVKADSKNKVKVMTYELETSIGIKYFRENREKEHKMLIQKLENH